MAETITLSDASRHFAKYVKAVSEGREFVMTRRGIPVARLAPLTKRSGLTDEQQIVRERVRRRMAEGWPIGSCPPPRDEIYADRVELRR